jgi:hypothetical protein
MNDQYLQDSLRGRSADFLIKTTIGGVKLLRVSITLAPISKFGAADT